jgi:lipoprotein-anchoring transpeptidase ErfK/SrfK
MKTYALLDLCGQLSSSRAWRLVCLTLLCALAWGCGAKRTVLPPEHSARDISFTERTLTTDELRALAEKDPALSSDVCLEILARVNRKDRFYVQQDLKTKNPLKVPNNFRAYLGWSPLPSELPASAGSRKLILVVKDLSFLGWYEHGKLLADAHVCIGKKRGWTKSGLYRVLEKDIDHVSSQYRSAYGYPSFMPYALRIYRGVWIHGGDVTGGKCSHGCINLPLDAAEKLYTWTKPGTIVLVVETSEALGPTLEKHAKTFGTAQGKR